MADATPRSDNTLEDARRPDQTPDAPLVIVVDDDDAGRYALVHPLRHAGFRVADASTGEQARRLVEELRPAAIVLDINLPDMDGRDLARQLKGNPDCAIIPIVQVSATYRSDEDWANALDRGADVFLHQPVSPTVLVATLNALLRTRAAERRLEETLHSITDAYIALDDDWRFVALNRRAEEILGITIESVRGQRAWASHPESENGEIARHYRRARAEGRPVHFEAPSPVLDRWFEIHAYPRPGRFDVYLRDITDRKRTAEELARSLVRERELRAEAEAAGRAKDEFLAILSHELRTPMNAILGWVTVLRSEATSPELTAKAIDIIHRNVMAQNQLIADLLDVSRIVSGKLAVEKRPIDPLEAADAAVETVRAAAEARGVTLRANRSMGMAVMGDPHRLHQILTNLLANAVKFTPSGGEVTVSVARSGAQAQITVADTGEGIDAAFLPHVFERFRQADASHTRRYRGLGLGLAIARFLTEEHGGTIDAASPGPGEGATFTVRLPLVAAQPERGILGRRAAVPASELAGARILVVEDEEDSRAIVSLILEKSGAAVRSVASVPAALDALRAYPVDLVVSDIEMPEHDGYFLIQQARHDPALAGLPMIALTAHAGESERTRALAEGFVAHVAKPVGAGTLTAIAARVLREKGRRPL
jgi:PAS domain S-box-containing protein